MIILPEKCPRGFTSCLPLSQILADDTIGGFICCGENDGTIREVEQDKYSLCFKSETTDTHQHYDKRDLTHEMSVIAQALAIIEELS